MTTPNTNGNNGEHAAPSRPLLEGLIVIWMLLLAVAFNLIYLYPEVAVKVIDLNDSGMHLLATDLAVEAIDRRQDFTDPWLGAIGMGYPLFHYYQNLPHISVALAHVLTFRVFPVVAMVNVTAYSLLSPPK